MYRILRQISLTFSILIFLGCLSTDAWAQDTNPSSLIDGVTVGAGIGAYLGDLDNNPGNDPRQFLLQAQPSLLIAAERRYTESLTLGLDLTYDHVRGARKFDGRDSTWRFSNNVFALNLTGGYDFDIGDRDILRVYAGGGPMLFLNPSYSGLEEPRLDGDGEVRQLGTRFVANITAGILLFERIRIGTHIPLTHYMDGWTGFRDDEWDIILFVNFGVRLDDIEDLFGR